jgi:methyl-accepting chemotaxis protein
VRAAPAVVGVRGLHAQARRLTMVGRARPSATALLAILVALLAVLALVATGCGSDDESESSASAAWADGFCGALTKWKSSLESVGETLKDVDQLSKAKIEEAAGDVSDANERLADDVDALGEPPQEAASTAKDAVDELRAELKTSTDQIESATQNLSSPTDVLKAVNTTSAALLTMSTDISATAATLQSVDASDEWKQAFADSDACQSLEKS